MSLLVLMLALALCAAAVIAWPWLRRGRPEEQARRAANVAAYRTRVAEVEDEQRDQLVDEDAARELKDEAAARLLDDAREGPAPESKRQGSRRGWAMGVVLAIFPLVVGGAWYVRNGSWRVAQEVATNKPSLAIARQDAGDVKGMVDRLRAELRKNPEDASRWALLGRSEMVLGDYREAARAYAQANQRTARSNPGWLVEQGLAQGIVQNRDLKGEPAQLFNAALKVAPDDRRALWYAGVAALQVGDRTRARELWSTLASQPGVPDDVRTTLERQIARLSQDRPDAALAPDPR